MLAAFHIMLCLSVDSGSRFGGSKNGLSKADVCVLFSNQMAFQVAVFFPLLRIIYLLEKRILRVLIYLEQKKNPVKLEEKA